MTTEELAAKLSDKRLPQALLEAEEVGVTLRAVDEFVRDRYAEPKLPPATVAITTWNGRVVRVCVTDEELVDAVDDLRSMDYEAELLRRRMISTAKIYLSVWGFVNPTAKKLAKSLLSEMTSEASGRVSSQRMTEAMREKLAQTLYWVEFRCFGYASYSNTPKPEGW